jgi:transposase, IS6 family
LAGTCAFSLSYREVEELLAERGLWVDHVTVWRWVQRYAPELQRRLRRHLKPTSNSWRVDETYTDQRQVARKCCNFAVTPW